MRRNGHLGRRLGFCAIALAGLSGCGSLPGIRAEHGRRGRAGGDLDSASVMNSSISNPPRWSTGSTDGGADSLAAHFGDHRRDRRAGHRRRRHRFGDDLGSERGRLFSAPLISDKLSTAPTARRSPNRSSAETARSRFPTPAESTWLGARRDAHAYRARARRQGYPAPGLF